jgi:hypothetical protein
MSNNLAVASASTTVLFAVVGNGLNFVVFGAVAFSVVMCLLFMVTRESSSVYDEIGRGGISREGEPTYGLTAPAPDSPAGRSEREQEIRQMLHARSERMVRRGEPALDVDAELARLLGGASPVEPAHGGERGHDAALVTEVRQLVQARNERRARQGLDELDVESEVARTLQELDP